MKSLSRLTYGSGSWETWCVSDEMHTNRHWQPWKVKDFMSWEIELRLKFPPFLTTNGRRQSDVASPQRGNNPDGDLVMGQFNQILKSSAEGIHALSH